MAVSETRRLIAHGKIGAGRSRTMELSLDDHGHDSVAAAGLPKWHPQAPPGKTEIDHDLKRKQKIEDAIAEGGDL